MHTQVAHPLAAEDGTIYLVECDECGLLGLFSDTQVGQFMYEHALAMV